jgi:hypothetical protein
MEVAGASTDLPEGALREPAGEGSAQEAWPAARRLLRPFQRFWTDEQRRRLELDAMLKQSNLPSSYDKAVAEARRKGAPPPPPPVPAGPWRDELMTSAFACVAQAEPLLREEEAPFLWEAIWPQQRDGRPAYNPQGVYVVKLWAAGSWRAVRVDDAVPVNHKGECVLAASAAKAELWPLLLAKAVYRVLEGSPLGTCSGDAYALTHSAAGGRGNAKSLSCGGVFAFVVAALTGWQTDAPTSLAALAAQEKADEAAQSEVPLPPAAVLRGDEGKDLDDDLDPMVASRALVWKQHHANSQTSALVW